MNWIEKVLKGIALQGKVKMYKKSDARWDLKKNINWLIYKNPKIKIHLFCKDFSHFIIKLF